MTRSVCDHNGQVMGTGETGVSDDAADSTLRHPDSMTFEELVAELERVATAMDRGDIGIEAAAELYARATSLHRAAQERLTAVQARLADLRGDA